MIHNRSFATFSVFSALLLLGALGSTVGRADPPEPSAPPAADSRRASGPPCFAVIVPATSLRGASFFGLAVGYSRLRHVEALLGKAGERESARRHRWHGRPWLASLGLEQVEISYAAGVISDMQLVLESPAEGALTRRELGLGPAPLAELLEDGGRYEIHQEQGLGLLLSARGAVTSIGLREFRRRSIRPASNLPPDVLSYVQVSSALQPPSFLGLRCGVVHIGHLHAVLGEPERAPNETDRIWEGSVWLRRKGLQRIRSRMNSDGTVLRLQLDLARPVTYLTLRTILGLTDPWRDKPRSGRSPVRIHSRQGVMMEVAQESVSSVLLYLDEKRKPTPMAAPSSTPGSAPVAPTPSGVAGRLVPELHQAVLARDASRVHALLRQGADVDGLHPRTREAPIHVAVRLGATKILRLLVEGGATLDLQRSDGTTALHLVAALNDTATARLLLTAGADPTVRDADGLLAGDLAGRPELVRALETAARNPRQAVGHEAARQAVNGYMEAVAAGDLRAMKRWVSIEPPPTSPQPLHPVPISWEIQEVDVRAKRGRAVLTVRHEALPEGHDRFRAEIRLVRRDRTWAVTEVRTGPYFPEGDVR